jgi:hypothetical protein
MHYAVKHRLGGLNNRNDAVAKVLNTTIPTAGLLRVFTVIWEGNPPVCQALALAVGQEKRTGEVRIAPKECIDKVKEVLERTDDPNEAY